MQAACWDAMDARPRRAIRGLMMKELPLTPGVYALYRTGQRVYVGKAAVLRQRVWNNHCGRGTVMTGSALRRNIAEHLNIASAADIKARRYQPTSDELNSVRNWLDGCEVAWIECDSEQAAEQLEASFKAEFVPLLTKR